MGKLNVLLSDTPVNLQLSSPLKQYSDIEQINAQTIKSLIVNTQSKQWLNWISTIRQSPELCLLPVFYLNHMSPRYHDLFDGDCLDGMEASADAIHHRIKLIDEKKRNHLYEPETRLLAYLFTRPQTRIQGFYHADTPYGYRYPLLEVLLKRDDGIFISDLQSWSAQHLIEKQRWVDEILLCPQCQCADVQFKNACPYCHHDHMIQSVLIQCHACGNINPVDETFAQEHPNCIHCQSSLTHIGKDYDNVIEDKYCKDCHASFIEVEPVANCLRCQQYFKPQSLIPQQLFTYHLSPNSEFMLRGTSGHISRQMQQCFQLISYDHFVNFTQWQIDMCQRHNSIYFSIMALKINNYEHLIATLGFNRADALLANLFNCIQKLFRVEDRITTQDTTLLCMLPMLKTDNTKLIRKRMHTLSQQLKESDGLNVEMAIAFITSDQIGLQTVDGQSIISTLSNKLILTN